MAITEREERLEQEAADYERYGKPIVKRWRKADYKRPESNLYAIALGKWLSNPTIRAWLIIRHVNPDSVLDVEFFYKYGILDTFTPIVAETRLQCADGDRRWTLSIPEVAP